VVALRQAVDDVVNVTGGSEAGVMVTVGAVFVLSTMAPIVVPVELEVVVLSAVVLIVVPAELEIGDELGVEELVMLLGQPMTQAASAGAQSNRSPVGGFDKQPSDFSGHPHASVGAMQPKYSEAQEAWFASGAVTQAS